MNKPSRWTSINALGREGRGYGKAHKAIRAHLMATVVMCEECTRKGKATVGTHADHKIPKFKGGTDAPDNYQLLCPPCHRDKSLRERGHKVKPTFGLDGWPIEHGGNSSSRANKF
jgi:5-methylcytosine-specific restriction protein A